jgi:hypothetical protein
MLTALLTLTLAAGPFPLPMIDGKALSVPTTHTAYRYPLRFERLRAFYQQQFTDAAQVKQTLQGGAGHRVLTLVSLRAGDEWKRAVVREGELETTVEVTPVLVLGPEAIEGQPPRPLVQFVLGRSPEVEAAIKSIDHTEQLRR